MPPSATPSAPSPAGDERNLVAVDEKYTARTFDERLRVFWTKNSKPITAVLVLILLAIVAKGGWEYLQDQRERELGQTYAAATTPAQIKAFAVANPQHPLGGVAYLRTADQAYLEGQSADAISSYEQAATIFKTGPLASRARLGLAMAKLQAGRAADAEAALKTFAADGKEEKAYRAEALYHLASLAASTRNAADVKTYSDQLMQLDPASPWTQRSLALRSNLPAEAAVPAAPAPGITLPGSGK